MSFQNIFRQLCGSILLVCILNVGGARAQSVCCLPPYLGTGAQSQELCVIIEETNPAGASECFRGISPLVISQTVVGDYIVDILTVQLIITPAGMAVTIEGTVRRIFSGSGGLSVIADGGLAGPFGEADGDLVLDGDATGISRTELGGGAGYPVAGTEDLSYFGFPRTIVESTLGAEPFGDQIFNQPIPSGAVAVHNHTHFHINVVGMSITIPSTVGIGDWEVNEPPVSSGFDPSTGRMSITLADGEDITITKHPVTGGLAINGECSGIFANEINFLNILGGNGDNSIDLSKMNKKDFPGLNAPKGKLRTFVLGRGGDDEIKGHGMGNTIYGGGGSDNLHGGNGNDHITGDSDDLTIRGGNGDDTIVIGGTASITENSRSSSTGGRKLHKILDNEYLSISDSSGTDTLSFAHFSTGISLDLSLFDAPQIFTSSNNKISLSGIFETFIGTPFDDKICLKPDSNVARHVNGGGADQGDSLVVDCMGNDVQDDNFTISVDGFQPITYENIKHCIHDNTSAIESHEMITHPDRYQLSEVYPSPFNAETNIEFSLKHPGNTLIQICNTQGQQVKVLIDQRLDAGSYSIRFNAQDLVSGIYFVNMVVNRFTDTKKMVLTK
jgi:hypothetical protein